MTELSFAGRVRFGRPSKYTDYAIGQPLEAARSKPWFADTLFVIVADHCASAAGKTALPVNGYHIPAFIWNPLLVPAEKNSRFCSQIDLPPTILGLMGWTYNSRFLERISFTGKPRMIGW